MIGLVLAGKIASLFLIMGMGVALVRSGVLHTEDSKVLSVLCLYLIMPCVILSAFQVERTPQVRAGLLLGLAAAVLLHILFIALTAVLRRLAHLDPVESTSVIYSNAGNLIIPLVTALLGEEWVIYATSFIMVQLFLMWSHGRAVLCGEKGIELKKILTNTNLLAATAGLVMFLTGLRFPGPVDSAVSSLAATVGPISMLVTGMLIGGMDLRKVFGYPRLWLVVALRLLACPLLAMALLKLSGLAGLVPDGKTVLLISLLATATPSASTVTQMAQVYDKDAAYAGAINVASTLLCILTMPVIVTLYQL